MANVVRAAIVDRRKELADQADTLKAQLQPVKDDLQARKAELEGVQNDIAVLDAWLAVNP